VALVAASRLIVAPAVVIGVIEVLVRSGVAPLAHDVRFTEHLIAAMPVSLSAAALVEKYGGDTALVSRAILVTTLASVVTAPAWMMLLDAAIS
jgi:predicted permease